MKKINLILVVVALLIGAFAVAQDTATQQQKYSSYADYAYNNSKYIFEATYISGEPFKDVKANVTRFSQKLNITKIYRNSDGKLKLGTVQLIDDITAFNIDDNGKMFVIPGSDYDAFSGTIYFCNDHRDSDYKINTDNEPMVLKQIHGEEKDEFYKHINLIPDITISDSLLQKKSPNENEIKQSPKPQKVIDDTTGNSQRYKEHLDNYHSYMNNLQTKNAHKSNREKHMTVVEDIFFSIAFATQTVSGPNHFLEFDVLVNGSSNSTYFDNCLLRISYNPLSFGNNIVGNGNVTITKGTNFNSLTYINPNTNDIDQTPTEMGVAFGTDFSQTTLNRTQLLFSQQQLLHFKMRIQNCNTNPQIQFQDVTFTYIFSYYANNPTDSITNTIGYDTSIYSGNITTTLCVPSITSFTSPVIPGANYPYASLNESQMVIQGNNFGVNQDTGNVYFRNADNGGASYIPLNHYDIVSWSENTIVVNVPSFIDSFPKYLPQTQWKYPCPGSGLFKVVTGTGDSAISPTPVLMPYGIENLLFTPYEKARLNLGNINFSGGYTFMIDTSIMNYADPILLPLIKKAIKYVACKTGANFIMGGSIAHNGYINDGVCVIFMGDYPTINHLAYTQYNTPYQCTHPIPFYTYNVGRSMQIGLLKNPSLNGLGYWQFDTLQNNIDLGRIDFYGILVHELLHAVGLKHVNQQERMWWQDQGNPIAGPLRWLISSDDIAGGGDIVIKSVTDSFMVSCIPGGNMQIFGNCLTGLGIPELNSNVSNFIMYPNPLNDNLLNVAYTLKQDSPVIFKVLDITGREVYSMNENKNSGEHIDQLNLANLSTGIYMIKIIMGDVQDTQKLVKIR